MVLLKIVFLYPLGVITVEDYFLVSRELPTSLGDLTLNLPVIRVSLFGFRLFLSTFGAGRKIRD